MHILDKMSCLLPVSQLVTKWCFHDFLFLFILCKNIIRNDELLCLLVTYFILNVIKWYAQMKMEKRQKLHTFNDCLSFGGAVKRELREKLLTEQLWVTRSTNLLFMEKKKAVWSPVCIFFKAMLGSQQTWTFETTCKTRQAENRHSSFN